MVKRIFRIFLLVLLVWEFSSGNGYAQEVDFKWALKPSYSLCQYSGELGSQFFKLGSRSDGVGLALSSYINPSVDLIFGLDYYRLNLAGEINETAYKIKGNLFTPAFSINYKFYNDYLLLSTATFKPYLGIGFGYMIGKSKGTSYDLNDASFNHFIDEVSFNFIAGVKYNISKRFAFFLELNSMLATTEELDGAAINRNNDKFGGGRIGLFIKIGGVEDDDKDGVPNDKDECPDTPIGVEVDEKGCPRDRDNDGIPDYEDDCPDEPGLPQYNGCPDTDGDGIIDKEDDCPELPGIPKYNGCPDSDGDGVIDPNDFCPDTPAGVVVDESGCPVDSDGDGLADYVDQCPDDYGPMEYMGCPEPPDVGWPPIEKDTPPEVHFETDQYELSPEAEEEIQKLVKYLFENSSMNIRLYGFADPRGTKEYNSVLSARRVEAVKKFLMRKGIPESRIAVRALGEIQEVKTVAGEEKMTVDQKFKKARKVKFETFFFMH